MIRHADNNNIFCTLFNSNYIDKGLVLYNSMVERLESFKLYVFAFDNLCYEILQQENLPNMIVVSLDEFETPELLKVKSERSVAEYCWTCKAWIVKYVFEKFNEQICTYIDSDMMFFSSPNCVFDEMKKNGCSTIIIPQRFKNEEEERIQHDRIGTYCGVFNTFSNSKESLEALNWWAAKCLEWCFYAVPGTTEWYGDMKYLNMFPIQFKGVYISEHFGLGLAPWNLCLVDEVEGDNNPPLVKVKKTGEVCPIILYHFEYINFVSKHILNAASGLKSKKMHKEIYDVYIKRIIDTRRYVEDKYNIKLPRKRRVNSNSFFAKIYQKYIMPLRRIKKMKDLYWIK